MRMPKSRTRIYAEMLVIAALVFIVDQVSKYWIRTHLALRETLTPIPAIGDWFRLIHWKNTGVAFGMFQGNGWILTTVGIIVVVGIIIYSTQVVNGPAFWRAALALELGGALGNLADRVNPALGYVVDFIWVGSFPVFNLADASIVIGAFVLVIGMWRQEKAEAEKQKRAMEENSDGVQGE
ncbi:MAG: signal peptidase II [Anaerolineaceae bacterium]|nr:signal peptidase II [Anaerolineaceae bacterium]